MKTVALLLMAIVLAACVETTPMNSVPTAVDGVKVQLARSAVNELLKDPFSSSFQREKMYRLENGDSVVCGEVNAKNSFGAFTGFAPYYVRMNAQGAIAKVFADEYMAPLGCSEASKGIVRVAN